MPNIPAEQFELTSVMFNMLRAMGQFDGSINEDASGHIKSFLEVYNSFKMPNYPDEVWKYVLYIDGS